MKRSAPFIVLYEDDNIVAVNKASGIAVGADRWDPSTERLDKLLAAHLKPAHLKLEKLFIIHRIDRDTSGLVVFAKNQNAHKSLSIAFESRQVKKRYIAAVRGRPVWKEMVCDLPLVPDGNKKHHTIIDKYQGKESLTRFQLLGSAGNYSIIEAIPETGRTHQIRVHLKSLGHSIVCDEFYGNIKPVFLSAIKSNWQGDKQKEKPLLSRLGLHAAELILPGGLILKAPISRDMAALIKQMDKCSTKPFDMESIPFN